MVAPRSSTMESPRAVGHTAAIAGRSMPGSVRRQKRAIAISAPVLPAETATSAAAQRLARLVVVAHGNIGVDDARNLLQRGMLVELGIDPGAVAEQDEFGA